MSIGELVTDPFSRTLGETSASATLVSEDGFWKVNVVIARQSGQPPADASEVDAQLNDDQGEAMELVERPRGALPEAGTSLSSSINAVFRFRRTKSNPAKLVVSYRGVRAEFAVRSP